MSFVDRMKKIIQKSLEDSPVSSEQQLIKTKEYGKKNFLIRDISRLEKAMENKFIIIGNEVYSALMEKHLGTIDKETPEIKDILLDIMNLEKLISAKKILLKKVD